MHFDALVCLVPKVCGWCGGEWVRNLLLDINNKRQQQNEMRQVRAHEIWIIIIYDYIVKFFSIIRELSAEAWPLTWWSGVSRRWRQLSDHLSMLVRSI